MVNMKCLLILIFIFRNKVKELQLICFDNKETSPGNFSQPGQHFNVRIQGYDTA